MVKILEAKNVHEISSLQWVWKDGALVKLMVNCEVNYGDRGCIEQVDILPSLKDTQVTTAKVLYNAIKNLVNTHFLG